MAPPDPQAKGGFERRPPVAPSKPPTGRGGFERSGAPPVKGGEALNPAERAIDSETRAKILQGPTAEETLAKILAEKANYGASTALSFQNIDFMKNVQTPYFAAQTDLAKADTKLKILQVPGAENEARIQRYIGQGLDNIESLIPIKNQISWYQEQAQELREQQFDANGLELSSDQRAENIRRARLFEKDATKLTLQYGQAHRNKFRSIYSATDIAVDAANGIGERIVPGTGGLYGIRPNGAPQKTNLVVEEEDPK